MLVDLCRQSIVFKEVDDLVSCLQLITTDADVELVRIKNRLDPSYDSANSAGYRDVGLNLRIVSSEAAALGVETHVCELQLIMQPFADLKVLTHILLVCDTSSEQYLSFDFNLVGCLFYMARQYV